MTNEQFETLVAKLENQAQSNPIAYQRKVLLLALIGNAYVGTILLLVIVVFTLLCASILALHFILLKLALIVGYFCWRMLKALWVKIEPPAGIKVTKNEAPELFVLIDELRHQLSAPCFHHVLITEDFNAGVVQSPRLGVFGWSHNYLLIGLPLMTSLSEEQFKAVLAHEFGHLAKGHGRVSNRIYRQRLRWNRLLAIFDASESEGGVLFKPFLNRFIPYFNAYSFPLARINEYVADETSARLTSPRVAAEALTSVSVIGAYLAESYWPKIHKHADDHPQPNFTPYYGIGHGVSTEVDESLSQAWLNQAMTQQTDLVDTHPALKDRLNAIGEQPHLALPEIGRAADQLLGRSLERITEDFDRNWKDKILPSWEQRYHEIQHGRSRLSELNALFDGGTELTIEEAYDRAMLTETISSPDDAVVQLQDLYKIAPTNPAICFSLGARLLARDDSDGCKLIEQAMHLDEFAIINGSQLLRDYHWRNDRKEDAEAWHQRLIGRMQLQEDANKEREVVLLSEKYDSHSLSNDDLDSLRTALKAIPDLRRGYLVKKQVKYQTHIPCYVFSFRVTGFLQLHSRKRVQKVLQQIQESVNFPVETIIINVDGDNYKFDRKFRRMRGARIL